MDSLRKNKPDRWTLVHAHGKWVGLNESDMGNSEVMRCHKEAVECDWNAIESIMRQFALATYIQRTSAASTGPPGLKSAHGEAGNLIERSLLHRMACILRANS